MNLKGTRVAATKLFEVAHVGSTLIVTPVSNLMSLDRRELVAELEGIHDQMQRAAVADLVIDFERIPYFGSAMLGAILSLSQYIPAGQGRLAFCNLSGLARDVLHIARFDKLGTVCGSRREALASIVSESDA
jgi:anti-anti-sigma factor